MRRPVPLFACGLWDNSEFSALKQLLKENSAAFPGETELPTNLFVFSSLVRTNICILKHLLLRNFKHRKLPFKLSSTPEENQTTAETKSSDQLFPLMGGNGSSPLCVSLRAAVEGLNNHSLYIIPHPAGLVDATIMSC